MRQLKSTRPGEEWKVTYATPVYGGWDLIIECSFEELNDLDRIISFCRTELSEYIEETMTLCGTQPNYP